MIAVNDGFGHGERRREGDNVTEASTNRRRPLRRVVLSAAATLTLAAAAAACGGDGSASDAGPTVPVDPAVQRGEEISRSQGCAGCHGPDFGGGAGPSWIGLAGSQVQLADGTTVVADEAYLVRSIADPSAEIVADYALAMPANSLTDAEIADVVAYITTLTAADTADG